MNIYLYVKQHKITGLKYFGKTIKDPYKYNGSGKYWLRHLKKHSHEHVLTLQVWIFDNQESCSEFAKNFSRQNNIVISTHWANLIEEDGINTPPSLLGYKQSIEHIEKSRKTRTGMKRTESFRKRMSILKTGKKTRPCPNDVRIKMKRSRAGKIWLTNKERTKQIYRYPDSIPDGWFRGMKIRKRPAPGLKRNRTWN